jgi:hypothetical protein
MKDYFHVNFIFSINLHGKIDTLMINMTVGGGTTQRPDGKRSHLTPVT